MNKTEAYYQILYTATIYNGIMEQICQSIKYNSTDRRKELKYMVDRYCREEILSSADLVEALEKYNKIAEENFGKLESEVD